MENIDISKFKISDDAGNILTYLLQKYDSFFITKKELAKELGVSYSSIDNFIFRKYGVPDYKKLGTSKNSKILFNLIDVAVFMADKTEVQDD